MTPQAQNIAIAKARPDRIHQVHGRWQYSDGIHWFNCKDNDPLSDLNAMHEAEKVLNHDNAREYCSRVAAITGQEFAQKDGRGALPIIGATLHATAAQRAAAFLRTLNLWDDTI